MPHHRLYHFLRHPVLHKVHRKRVPESLRGYRPHRKRGPSALGGCHRLTYPGAHGVRTTHVPETFPLFRLYGGKVFTQALHVSRIGERQGARRVRLCFAQRGLLFPGRASAPARGDEDTALLQGVQHHEWRLQRATVRAVQYEVLRRQREHLVQASAGVPERVDQQALFQVRLMGQQDGHLGREQVAWHGGAERSSQVSQRHRRAVVEVARRHRHVFGADRAVQILLCFAG